MNDESADTGGTEPVQDAGAEDFAPDAEELEDEQPEPDSRITADTPES